MTETSDRPNPTISSEGTAKPESKTSVEEFSVSVDTLWAKVKESLGQGNVRRLIIKSPTGQILLDIPLSLGLGAGAIGAIIFPPIMAIALVGWLAARLTLVIERNVSE